MSGLTKEGDRKGALNASSPTKTLHFRQKRSLTKTYRLWRQARNMQMIRPPELELAAPIRAPDVLNDFGTAEALDVVQICGDLGLTVDFADEIYGALSEIADDPTGYSIFIHDCDRFGGMDRGRKIALLLRSIAPRLSVILVTHAAPTACVEEAESRSFAIVMHRPHAPLALCTALLRASRGRRQGRVLATGLVFG
jgi:hypothetical protein